MSVLRSKRQIAQTEYENTMSNLYKYSSRKTIAVPKRRQKWLCDKIDTLMNSAYSNAMEINTSFFRNNHEMNEHIQEATRASIKALRDLQQPLLVLWNVQKYEIKTMAEWLALINKEISLLYMLLQDEGDLTTMYILDWRKINSTAFLKNMSELHRYTHGKVANAKMCYDSTQGRLLIEHVNNAFYHTMEANRKIPTTKEEYLLRDKHLSESLSNLNKMNRSLLSYFNLMQYSENVMNEWSDMLVTEMKLIQGVKKSDKERFKGLK